MSEPISPTGSPGQVSQVVTQSMSLGPTAMTGGSTRLDPAATASFAAAGVFAATGLPAAADLALSPESAPATTGMTPPKAMSMEDAAKAFQEYLTNLPSDLQFQPDAESGIVVFKVVNPITGKVLRQYPPEEMLAMARSLKEGLKSDAAGIIVDHKS